MPLAYTKGSRTHLASLPNLDASPGRCPPHRLPGRKKGDRLLPVPLFQIKAASPMGTDAAVYGSLEI